LESEIKIDNTKVKCRTPNEQFATSGGATRPTVCAEQQLMALVRALPIPPPAASCHHIVRKPCGGQSSEL